VSPITVSGAWPDDGQALPPHRLDVDASTDRGVLDRVVEEVENLRRRLDRP
jgi:hypothetical protein